MNQRIVAVDEHRAQGTARLAKIGAMPDQLRVLTPVMADELIEALSSLG